MEAESIKGGGYSKRAADALLTVAAIGGLACVILVLMALFLHITLIMFKTGSMSPTIPAGSLAIVRQIPASEIKVGDVVTVDRPQTLPITHRVVSIAPAPGNDISITLRGDANPADDPQPYVVGSVRIVLFSIPQLAYAVRAVSNPIVLGGTSIGAAGLVTWTFWPGKEPAPRRRKGTARHLARGGPLAVAVFLTGANVFLMPTPVQAATTEETIRGPVLTLTSIMDQPVMDRMAPGTTVPWQIGVSSHTNDPGTIRITLTSQGPLSSDSNGLELTVRMCDVRWVVESCPTGGVLLRPAAGTNSVADDLASIPTNQQRWILVDASLPANRAVPPSGTATLTLTATGAGDELSAGGSVGPLPTTGTGLLRPSLTAVAAVTAGLLMASLARWGRTKRSRRGQRPR
ncbi:signal peptidase I [Arthrobacter sp. TMN-49]